MQKSSGCFTFWYTNQNKEDEDDDLLDQSQIRLSQNNSRKNSRYTMSVGSLIGNEFAKEVKIGPFMDCWKSMLSPTADEQDKNIIKWGQLVRFIDERCLDYISEIDPKFVPNQKKINSQKNKKSQSFLNDKNSAPEKYENINDFSPRRFQSEAQQKIQSFPKQVTSPQISNEVLSYDPQLIKKNQQSESSSLLDSPKQRSLEKNVSKETDSSDTESKQSMHHNKFLKSQMEISLSVQGKLLICYEIQGCSDDLLVDSIKEGFSVNKVFQKKNSLAVYDGPPQDLRWSCWKVLLLRDNPKIFNLPYENQLERECKVGDCIKKELHRTLVTQPFLQCDKHKEIGQQQLERVLMAIANFLEDVSYCQGMNFLACKKQKKIYQGYLLMNSSADEANSFKAFISLLLSPKHLMKHCYQRGLPLMQFLCFVVHEQMKIIMPDVEQKLGPDTDSLWLQKYILTLFLDTIESDKCLRLWDYIFLRGAVRAIPELTLGILQQIRPQIQNLQDIDLYEALTKRLEKNISINLTISLARRQYRIQTSKIKLLAKAFLVKNHNFSRDFKVAILNYNPQSIPKSIESSFVKI